MSSSSSNFKIDKMTYDEYLELKKYHKHILSRDVFEVYQNSDRGNIHFFKIRVNFDIILFSISNSTLCFFNKDIYEYDFRTIERIFKTIALLDINQNICLYTPFKSTCKGVTEDYIDNTVNKLKFINKYEKYFKKQEFKNVWKIQVENKLNNSEEVMIENKESSIICKLVNKPWRLLFDIIDDELVLSELAYDRFIEDHDETEIKEYFRFIEETICMLSNKYSNIYAYTNVDFDYHNYFNNVVFIKTQTIYQYWI